MSGLSREAPHSGPREFFFWVTILALSVIVVGAVAWLLWRSPMPGGGDAHGSFLPSLNASLNAATTVCLLFGWRAIRGGNMRRHRAWMIAAVLLSGAFLTSYVIHHFYAGSVRFVGPAWLRQLYLAILLLHIVLSAVIVPLVLLTLGRALRGDFTRHRQIARWTLPVWLVVSVTGVIVYWMVYHLSPGLR